MPGSTLRAYSCHITTCTPHKRLPGSPAKPLNLLCRVTQVASQAPTASEPPAKLDQEELAAVKQALEALFQEQSVVTLEDVRVWLNGFAAAPKAQQAAGLRDVALSALLLGGGSIVLIRYGHLLLTPCHACTPTLVPCMHPWPQGAGS